MSDDRIVRLLEELRDLLRQHVESYRQALRTQQESIELQRAALRRVRLITLAAGLALVVVLVVVAMLVVKVWPLLP